MLKKAHELATLSGANVYFIIDHPRATVTYNSVEGRHWPPSDEILVNCLKPKSSQILADKAPGKPLSSLATNVALYYE